MKTQRLVAPVYSYPTVTVCDCNSSYTLASLQFTSNASLGVEASQVPSWYTGGAWYLLGQIKHCASTGSALTMVAVPWQRQEISGACLCLLDLSSAGNNCPAATGSEYLQCEWGPWCTTWSVSLTLTLGGLVRLPSLSPQDASLMAVWGFIQHNG